MLRSTVLTAVLLLPTLALGATPEDLIGALDIDWGDVVPGTATTTHPTAGPSDPAMFDVRSSLGLFTPLEGPSMALIATDIAATIEDGLDHDFPPGGLGGDHATLQFALTVPADANSFSFNFSFFSREYPEYIGNIYNDLFSVHIDDGSGPMQIVFDAFGNPVSVNNALFVLTDPAPLANTGFEQHGATGWVTTLAPCTPGSELQVTFTLYDEADGIYDSAVLIDHWSFGEGEVEEPITDPSPETPMEIGFLSPKEGDLDGGYEVFIHGAGFSTATQVFVDDVLQAAELLDPEVLRIPAMPGAESERSVDLELVRGDEVLHLAAAFTYWDEDGAELPPVITGAAPARVHPDGDTELRVRGRDIAPDARALFVSPDGSLTTELDVLDRQDLGGGQAELLVLGPPQDEGWVDLVVLNPSGLRSTPGYPILVTEDAADPDLRPGPPGGCGCAAGGPAAMPLMLLLLGARRRR